AAASPCPGTATLTVMVDNQSDDSTLSLTVDGALAPDANTCDGDGALATYGRPTTLTMTCSGTGLIQCGQITGLQPGSWIHRLSATVPGSAEQQQWQRLVLLGKGPGDTTAVSNMLVWTVYPRTFTVTQATQEDVLAQLAQAKSYTDNNPGRSALVTFSI